MTRHIRRTIAFCSLAALVAAAPFAGGSAEAAPSPGNAAAAQPRASADAAEPVRFVTRHRMTLGGKPFDYQAIAGETYLSNRAGEPIGSIFSFSYIKDAPAASRRPVMFVFNGGPGSSSIWLHMGVVGPRRLVLDREVDPSTIPPFGVADNPHTLLDVADLVFIDPVGTGWSRAIGAGTTADFWGVNEDAEAVSQFIELWLTEHDRWNAPKYLMGESYGSMRAALLPRALMGSPIYGGVMRGITVNGIILLGTTLGARGADGSAPNSDLDDALELPAIADTAWYHRRIERDGRDLEQVHQDAVAFALGDYVEAIGLEKQGKLPGDRRAAIVAKLVAFTGLPSGTFDKSIRVSSRAFAKMSRAGEGLELGIYDSRYTLPLANSGNDPVADDPAMGRYVPGFVSAFHQMATGDLQIRMNRPYGAIVWKDLLAKWNWKRDPLPQTQNFATDLAVAMRRNPELGLLVASGYYDFGTPSATAEYAVRQASPPADRVTYKRYASGHMLYLGDTAGAFAEDVRALVRRTSR